MGQLLSIDQGTTSSRAILFDANLRPVASEQREFTQFYPAPGLVEHDSEEIWETVLATARAGLARAEEVAALGIANQRETAIVWERDSGRAVHRAIVWQDRRTAAHCERLRAEGAEPEVAAKTGLLLDPYFSATKVAWILEHTGLRGAAEAGRLAFGTVDSWLLWKLTGGRVHATDATNAARTLLYDIRRGDWDEDLLRLFGVPRAMLPEVRDTADDFGTSEAALFGRAIRICALVGDQQAATVGQACVRPGMVKSTYGTGCFAVLNTGAALVPSANRLLSTVAYRLDGAATYALEGSIFVAGAAVQWLRDGLKIIGTAAETGALAEAADPAEAVYLVPAFVGLGAPYWDAEARGALFGLTRGTGRAEIARAALESVAYQTRDLIEAMGRDWPQLSAAAATQASTAQASTARTPLTLRVDGGMTASDWTMQFLADMLGAPVERPRVLETTALGAAALAGLEAGLVPDLDALEGLWRLDRRFAPGMDAEERERRYAGWADAVSRTLTRRT
jgi:glycerol kinase